MLPLSTPASIHQSYWLRDVPLQQRFDTLRDAHRTGVAIIGGGITGLSTALELLQRGLRVTVLEASVIGAGTSGGTSGHLDAHPEMGPARLIRTLGTEKARQYVALRRSAIDAIEHRAGGDCDMTRVPAYQYTEHHQHRDALRSDFEACQTLGLAVRWDERPPIPRAVCGYRIEGMARFHATAYLRRLADQVIEAGGVIFENSQVTGQWHHHQTQLEAGEGSVQFDHVVCAVHSNYTDAMRVYLMTPAYQSYVMAVRVADPPPDGLYWDDADPYFYTRHADSSQPDLLIVGGCDHRTGAGDERGAEGELEKYVRDRYDVREIVARWSAELFEPTDGLPIIGQLPGKDNVWIATGLSGVGLSLGTAAGWLLADQITGQRGHLQDDLSPARLGLAGMANLVSEQMTSTASYARRVLPSHEIDPAALRDGEGAVGMVDGQHLAVCRDSTGSLHRRKPICVHMGGVVHWNEAAQTWDCPVHGGRYSADGKRIYGPPQGDLEPADQ